MPIQVICPSCKTEFKVSEKFAGKQGPCPKCKTVITVPNLEDEVKVHAPEDAPATSAASQVRQASKPLTRQETKITPIAVGLVVISVVGAFAAAYFASGVWQNYWLRGLGLLGMGVPLAIGGYSVLRDDELEPYRGLSLVGRSAIATAVYTVLWGAFAAIPPNLGGSPLTLMFIAPLFFVVGTATAYFCFDLDAGSAFFHYCLFVLASLALGKTAGIALPWENLGPSKPPSNPGGVIKVTELLDALTTWLM